MDTKKCTDDRFRFARRIVVVCVAASLGLSMTWAPAQELSPEVTARDDKGILIWQFRTGDRYDVQQQTVATVTSHDSNRYRNEIHREYGWYVTGVGSDGSATVAVAPRRIRLEFELPYGQFDSDQGDSDILPVTDDQWRTSLAQARSWVGARFTCGLDASGKVTSLWGSYPVVDVGAPIAFTPGAMGRLPGVPPDVGVMWSHEVRGWIAPHVRGTRNYRVTEQTTVDGHPAYRIEAITSWTGRPDRADQEFGPTFAVGHFDPVAGHFLDHMEITSGQETKSPGEMQLIRIATSWHVKKVSAEVGR